MTSAELERLSGLAYEAGRRTLGARQDLWPDLPGQVWEKLQRYRTDLEGLSWPQREAYVRKVGHTTAIDCLRADAAWRRRCTREALLPKPQEEEVRPSAEDPAEAVDSAALMEAVKEIVRHFYGPVPTALPELDKWSAYLQRRITVAELARRVRYAEVYRRMQSGQRGLSLTARRIAEDERKRLQDGAIWRRRVAASESFRSLAAEFEITWYAAKEAFTRVNARVLTELRRDGLWSGGS